ncbi:MAG: ATP synthase F1 subunit epsilon [Planctomycetales bacterium]|nr:ATP synthase F1 subunit epsilon [Planctomycetales bacterium]
MSGIRCRVVTPDRTHLDSPAEAVTLPAVDGEIGVLPGHTPLLALLGTGVLRVRSPEGARAFALAGGFAEVGPDRVVVAAREVTDGRDLDPEAAEKEAREVRDRVARGAAEREARSAALGRARARVRAARVARGAGAPPAGGAEHR